jgi:hypothetical protein
MRSVEEMVKGYTEMKATLSYSSMYHEAKYQYIDMANGGDGGELGFERNGETTCRGINYKDYPDAFFREVCERMGWIPLNETIMLEAYSADPV